MCVCVPRSGFIFDYSLYFSEYGRVHGVPGLGRESPALPVKDSTNTFHGTRGDVGGGGGRVGALWVCAAPLYATLSSLWPMQDICAGENNVRIFPIYIHTGV